MFQIGDRVRAKNGGTEDLYIADVKTVQLDSKTSVQLVKILDGSRLEPQESDWVGSRFYEHAAELPYIIKSHIVYTKHYNPDYGDSIKCVCGHIYAAHFDSYNAMEACGCKYCYCECDEFERG